MQTRPDGYTPFEPPQLDRSLSAYERIVLVTAVLVTIVAAVMIGLGLHSAIETLGDLT